LSQRRNDEGDSIVGIAYHQRTHHCGTLRREHIGQTVTLAGWVNSSRDHGGMVFVDLRDHSGFVQLAFKSEIDASLHELAQKLHNESVLAVTGTVIERSKINKKVPTGEVEIEITAAEVLSVADPLPFQLAEAEDTNEELRLKYRFLDMRRTKVQDIFRMRHRVAKTVRDYFDSHGFVEIETPVLTKSTPEGARDYLVPSRVQPGSFFALPQSPQIFKQLCMVAGFDRYAQIVRCFRDEDLRADRQPEFTQVDMEMAFVQRDDVMTMVEGCVQAIFKAALDIDIPLPLPRMSEEEAMRRFGIDRPDTRFGMELQDISGVVAETDFPMFREALDAGGVVKAIVAKQASMTRKVIDGLTEELRGIGATGLPYTKVEAADGQTTFAGGVAKFLKPLAEPLCSTLGAEPGDIIFLMAGTFLDVCKYLHYLRTKLGRELDLIPANRWDLLWVIDFPLVMWDEEENRWLSTHHPFTAPLEADLPLLETDPGKVRDQAYDLVLNGLEVAGGSIRIHRRDIQQRIFNMLGISPEEANEKFEFLLDALRFGAPPHGGIAFGLDRWVMLLSGAESLRDVIPFPKTQRATCPLTDAPGPVAEAQLEELHLKLNLPAGAQPQT
jgi:aspartyl-tRNA synthetase